MRFPLALLAFLLPGVAAAQTVSVQSGEHPTFTRIVLPLPDGVTWSLETGPQAAQVTLDAPDIRFDTSSVFDRVPRHRLAAISQNAPGAPLRLELGCLCEVEAFPFDAAWLVVDIRDPASVAETQAPGLPLINPETYRFGLNRAPSWQPGTPATGFPIPAAAPAGMHRDDPPQTAPTAPVPAPAPSANQAEERLLLQIARAANQGLVTLKQHEDITPLGKAPTPIPAANLDAARNRINRTPDTAPQPVLRAVTSIDRDMAGRHPDTQTDPMPCPTIPEGTIASWGDHRPFSQQITPLRAALVGEFDRIDPEIALRLARAYLYFGFGAEARQILDLADLSEEPAPQLAAIAHILDGNLPAEPNPFAGQMNCAGDAALWAFLSTPEDRISNVQPETVLQVFASLPAHLQDLLASRVSAQFVKASKTDAAAQVLRIVQRRTPNPAAEIGLARARVSQARNDPETAAHEAERLTAHATPATPEALISLVEARWLQQVPPAADIPETIAAFEAEYRRTVLGAALRRARALALALLNRFPEAFDQAEHIHTEDGAQVYEDLVLDLLAAATKSGDDMAFLTYGLDLGLNRANRLSADLSLDMARRFLKLGFPETAMQLLSGVEVSGSDPTSKERRLLKAEAALARNLPHRAMVELLRLEGDRANALRAQALMQTGNFQSAEALLRDSNDPESASRAAWLAGTWQDPGQIRDTRYDRAARLVDTAGRAGVATPDDKPLTQARQLLDDSRRTRDDISALFDVLRDQGPENPGL